MKMGRLRFLKYLNSICKSIKFFKRKSLLFIVLHTALFSNNFNLEYSYGLHGFVVQDESHTAGINAGIYAEYITSSTTHQNASFEIFAEHDESELDPDHIPVWFKANYGFATILMEQHGTFKLNAVVDFDWKMNTVSSVEQYLKSGLGLEFIFKERSLQLATKIIGGTYYLEIDDDVPIDNGFKRNDLDVGYKAAVMYGASMLWDIRKDVSLGIEFEEWNERGKWLERNTWVELTYKKTEELYIVFLVEKTIYNLANFRKEGIEILPWNQDTLFKLVVRLPLDW